MARLHDEGTTGRRIFPPRRLPGKAIRIQSVRQPSMDQTSARRIDAEDALAHGVDRGRTLR
jgi:hypothetical protein